MKKMWVVLRDWPDYKLSNYGEVYSIRRDRLLKVHNDSYGYDIVNLCKDGVWSKVSVHKLVATEFVDGWFEGAEINHIDGIKNNNKPENLEWVTHKENMQHAYSTGLIIRKKDRVIKVVKRW